MFSCKKENKQKLHKWEEFSTFPVLERKDKGRKRCLLSVRIRRFAGPQIPAGFESTRILSDSRDRATLWGLQERSGIVLSKKGKHPKARKSENAKRRSFLERKGDHLRRRWWIVDTTLLGYRKACWCSESIFPQTSYLLTLTYLLMLSADLEIQEGFLPIWAHLIIIC